VRGDEVEVKVGRKVGGRIKIRGRRMKRRMRTEKDRE